MIYVGIDVAKDKHDCIIVDSDGVIRFPTFTIPNNKQGFRELLTNLKTCGSDFAQIKVGLEATGHYSDNLLEFLIANDLPTTVINPLHTNLYRKGLSLRKTKTDTVDAHSIVTMLRTECLKPYSKTSYHVRELKSLTRYRFSLVQDCARLKSPLMQDFASSFSLNWRSWSRRCIWLLYMLYSLNFQAQEPYPSVTLLDYLIFLPLHPRGATVRRKRWKSGMQHETPSVLTAT
jgi:hypothetical protein